jgi:hypothetical protein
MSRKKEIVPRNGHTLVVGVVARISGCQNQKEASLEDQEAHARQIIEEMYDGPVEYRVIATKGKGERLDRPELVETEAMLRTRELDFLFAEDIGRIVRGGAAVRFCGIAVDHGTRVLAPNDCIDTNEDNWEEEVLSACRDQVGHNEHATKRIKQKMMNRFKTKGEARDLRLHQAGGREELQRLAEGSRGRTDLPGMVPPAARNAELHGRRRLAQPAPGSDGPLRSQRHLGRRHGPADHSESVAQGIRSARREAPDQTQ